MKDYQMVLVGLLSCLMQYCFALVAKQPLYIGSISPLTGKSRWWGRGIPLAAEMAFDMINKDTRILNDYELRLISNDSRVRKHLIFYFIIFLCISFICVFPLVLVTFGAEF
jgi:ABC-type branched-subunit amino acid transport system substrate-binding protein